MLSKNQAFLRATSFKRDAIETFDTYRFNIPAVREVQELEFHPDITFNEDAEHFAVTRAFLNDPQEALRRLLTDDNDAVAGQRASTLI